MKKAKFKKALTAALVLPVLFSNNAKAFASDLKPITPGVEGTTEETKEVVFESEELEKALKEKLGLEKIITKDLEVLNLETLVSDDKKEADIPISVDGFNYDFPEESGISIENGKIQLGENFDISKPIEGTFSFKEKGKEELTVGKIIITVKTEMLATIPFKTKYVESNNLNFGKTKIQQEGVNGTKKAYKEGKETQEEIIKDAKDQVIEVGNKKVETIGIPFNKITKKTTDLKVGETKIETKGVDGSKTITTYYNVEPDTGELTDVKDSPEEKIEKEPVDEVTLVGATQEEVDKENRVKKEISTEKIKAKIIYKGDPSLEVGKKVEKEKAVDGEKEIVTITKIVDGKEVTTKEERIVTEAKNGITILGTKEVKEEEVDFKTTKTEDPTMKKGQESVKTKGVKGKKTTTRIYEVDEETGQLKNPKETEMFVKPVDEEILVGTKVIVDKSKLIALAKEVKEKANTYDLATQSKLKKLAPEIKKVIDNEGATQKEVDEAYKKLDDLVNKKANSESQAQSKDGKGIMPQTGQGLMGLIGALSLVGFGGFGYYKTNNEE